MKLPLEWTCEPRTFGGFAMVVKETVYPWRTSRFPHSRIVVDSMRPEALWLLCLHDAERLVARYDNGKGAMS